MISSLKMTGYRAFSKFEMADLGRVNLLVGRNNSGKTSILEGLYLLASGANAMGLLQVLARRGEQVMSEPASARGAEAEADVSHLFYGHEIGDGTEFTLSTKNDNPGTSVTYKISEFVAEDPELFGDTLGGPPLALHITGMPDVGMPLLPLTERGALNPDRVRHSMRLSGITSRQQKGGMGRAQYITTDSLTTQQVLRLWNAIVLTPDEDLVIQSLQILDRRIERIAPVQAGTMQYLEFDLRLPTRGGFYLKLSGDERRVPIGSFGDGMWRLFSIAVALVQAKNGLLLIDEIDTGLHYTVMADMWKLVNQASKLFNVQVFATTHSYDCVHSLAAICRPNHGRGVTIQRVESDKTKSVAFSEAEIRMAADREIEIR
jgi:energy-coupling factor transporter ATP-binding protein EcfA2